jgi:glutathione-regulated potassium-efflux system protein KefB
MDGEHHGIELLPVITLLAAAVVFAPLFKRLGLGAVLGYLAGGLVIGPFGLRVFTEPASILQIAELGVVLFLFIIGLEMQPSRLWALRRQIFGLGLLQVVACAALLTAVGVLTGFPIASSFVAGAGFVLTSTAIVMQLLEERGALGSAGGQGIVSILLLEDLMIVPLLALVAFLAPIAPGSTAVNGGIDWEAVGIGAGSVAALLVAGRFLLNPLFGLLASARAREVMTAAALLVVLGSAYAMQLGGLSMAMGAFLAGVLLSESTYRHQLEVDVEPFRGILLGLFFLAVGMSLDLSVVAQSWRMILFYVAVFMAQGGEFAFVLYAAAASAGIVNAEENAILTAIIIVSMVVTPLAIAAMDFVRKRAHPSTEGYERPDGLTGTALVVGFGRVGQIASQLLLARGYEISIIDTDVEMIDTARDYDFKIYYGDGTRLDILRAAGAASAGVVLVCVDKPADGTRIAELVKAEFPHVPVLARASDRRHSMELIRVGADFEVRETFESAIALGGAALDRLGATASEIAEISARIRKRDRERLQLETVGGMLAGKALFSGRAAAAEEPPAPDVSELHTLQPTDPASDGQPGKSEPQR